MKKTLMIAGALTLAATPAAAQDSQPTARDAIGSILGSLSSLFVPASRFMVFPVVGYIDFKPEFKPNPDEVQQIIEVELQKLLDPENIGTKVLIKDCTPFKAPAFNVDDHLIWGATAMILGEFVEVVNRTGFFS